MSSNRQKTSTQFTDKAIEAAHNPPPQELPDDRYPGTFFRIPGVPTPGKTTWSLTK